MKRFLIILNAFLLLTVISCKKEKPKDVNPSVASQDNTGNCFSMSGITITNNVGDIIAPYIDSSDWNFNDMWSCEKFYFTDTNFNTVCVFNDTNLYAPVGYPNPCISFFQLRGMGIYTIPEDTNVSNHDRSIGVEIAVLNQRKERIAHYLTNKYDAHGMYIPLFLLDSLASDTLFRVYYKLTDQNNCVKMGHGDIIRQ